MLLVAGSWLLVAGCWRTDVAGGVAGGGQAGRFPLSAFSPVFLVVGRETNALSFYPGRGGGPLAALNLHASAN